MRLKQCCRQGCPMYGEWKVSINVWADGTTPETGVPLEVGTLFTVCTAHRDDGNYPDIIDAKIMRRVGAELRAEHKPPADWRTAAWKYTRVDGKPN